jgi:hypothetical protein
MPASSNRVIAISAIILARLTKQEQSFLTFGMAPTSTATWFQGEGAVPILHNRIESIVKANPWLTGNLVKKDGNLHIAYNSTTENIDNIFQVVHDDSIRDDIPLEILAKKCSYLLLQPHQDLHQPFWKVVVVPCPGGRFLVLVSMSHVVGDGHSFYSLYNMLMGGQKVKALQVNRVHSTQDQQQEALGAAEANVMTSIGLVVSVLRGFFLSRVVAPILRRKDLQVASRFLLVDEIKMTALKETAAHSVPFVSTNDVITSWFLRNCKCPRGLMMLNFRGRLQDHTVDLAGNYENCLYYRREDFATPALIRQSLQNLKRVVTANHPIRSSDMAWQHVGVCTNWASFCSSDVRLPNCHVLAHLPLYDVKATTPSTMTMCIIFQARPQQLGLLILGTPEKLQHLSKAPFEADEPFVLEH